MALRNFLGGLFQLLQRMGLLRYNIFLVINRLSYLNLAKIHILKAIDCTDPVCGCWSLGCSTLKSLLQTQ